MPVYPFPPYSYRSMLLQTHYLHCTPKTQPAAAWCYIIESSHFYIKAMHSSLKSLSNSQPTPHKNRKSDLIQHTADGSQSTPLSTRSTIIHYVKAQSQSTHSWLKASLPNSQHAPQWIEAGSPSTFGRLMPVYLNLNTINKSLIFIRHSEDWCQSTPLSTRSALNTLRNE